MLVTIVILVSAQVSFGQERIRPRAEQELAKTIDLFATETIPFSAPPPNLVVSGIKCDLNGNIYLVYSDAPQAVLSQPDGVPMLPIRKLSLESKTAVPFAIPSISEYQHLLRYDFAVDSRGKVSALISASYQPSVKNNARAAYLIIKYKDDGTMDSFFEIGGIPGKKIVPLRFAAFADGNFLVMGNALDSQKKLQKFAGVFDRGGTFVTDIKVSDDFQAVTFKTSPKNHADAAVHEGKSLDPAETLKEGGEDHVSARGPSNILEPVNSVSSGFSVGTSDGNVYFLHDIAPFRLYEISSGGYIVREFELIAPASGLSPVQMGMAGDGRIFIEFGYVTGEAPPEESSSPNLITVLDTNSGLVTAVYRLAVSERASDGSACAISPYEFLFFGTSESNKLKVVRYSPR